MRDGRHDRLVPGPRRGGSAALLEADDEGWAIRQIAVRAADAMPVTAVSLGVLRLRDHGDLGARSGYERRHGVLAEGTRDGGREQPHTHEISPAGM